jgi:hypothetical protein
LEWPIPPKIGQCDWTPLPKLERLIADERIAPPLSPRCPSYFELRALGFKTHQLLLQPPLLPLDADDAMAASAWASNRRAEMLGDPVKRGVTFQVSLRR